MRDVWAELDEEVGELREAHRLFERRLERLARVRPARELADETEPDGWTPQEIAALLDEIERLRRRGHPT